MPTLAELEQAFWAKVWRCTHRWPCKKCCWPWQELDLSLNWARIWQTHASFRGRAVYRLAYELFHGVGLLPGKRFHICHTCHFGPCCNPCHLRLGGVSDNMRDTALTGGPNRAPIVLPDGRVWSYQQAWLHHNCFRDACEYQQVWAGPIPASYERDAFRLDFPREWTWPGEPWRGEWPGEQFFGR